MSILGIIKHLVLCALTSFLFALGIIYLVNGLQAGTLQAVPVVIYALAGLSIYLLLNLYFGNRILQYFLKMKDDFQQTQKSEITKLKKEFRDVKNRVSGLAIKVAGKRQNNVHKTESI